MKEICYNEDLFAIDIECKICGGCDVSILYNNEDNSIIIKCGDIECGYSDIIYL